MRLLLDMAGIDYSGSVTCKASQKVTEGEDGDKLSEKIQHSMTISVVCKDDTVEDVFEIIYKNITDNEPTLTIKATGSKKELDEQLKSISTEISKLGGQTTLDFGY